MVVEQEKYWILVVVEMPFQAEMRELGYWGRYLCKSKVVYAVYLGEKGVVRLGMGIETGHGVVVGGRV